MKYPSYRGVGVVNAIVWSLISPTIYDDEETSISPMSF